MRVKNLKDILEFVNEIRVKDQGRAPIKRLPKGIPGDPNNCPIASAINHEFAASVGARATYKTKAGRRKKRNLPEAASDFISEFDSEMYPHLIDAKKLKERAKLKELARKREELAYNLSSRKYEVRNQTNLFPVYTKEEIDEMVSQYKARLLVKNASNKNAREQNKQRVVELTAELDAFDKKNPKAKEFKD